MSECDRKYDAATLEIPRWGTLGAETPEVDHRQWHPELGRWVYPDEPEYEREAGR